MAWCWLAVHCSRVTTENVAVLRRVSVAVFRAGPSYLSIVILSFRRMAKSIVLILRPRINYISAGRVVPGLVIMRLEVMILSLLIMHKFGS